MSWGMTATLCAASSVAVAAPLILRLNAVTRQRDNARASANLFMDWWVAASDRALRAEYRVSLAHEQHVAAGKRSRHLTDEERALRDATTERLRHCAPCPPRPREEIEAEVAARRASIKSPQPRGSAARAPVSLPMMEGANHG